MVFSLVLYYSECVYICVCVCVCVCMKIHNFQSFKYHHNSMKKILLLFHYGEVKKLN